MLSDQLIELGKKSNPKSNLSQNEAASKMLLLMIEHRQHHSDNQLWYIINHVCRVLNKEGWPYFKLSLFMKTGEELELELKNL